MDNMNTIGTPVVDTTAMVPTPVVEPIVPVGPETFSIPDNCILKTDADRRVKKAGIYGAAGGAVAASAALVGGYFAVKGIRKHSDKKRAEKEAKAQQQNQDNSNTSNGTPVDPSALAQGAADNNTQDNANKANK